MRAAGPGGGVGGMMGGMRGMGAHGMNVANMDNLTDDSIVGSAYDHKVVVRLMTYIWPYRKDAFIAIAAVLMYTLGNVTIPLLMLIGIKWAVNAGDVNHLHIVGILFAGATVLHFGANIVQFVYIPKVGQGILFSLRTGMFNHLQELSPAFFHRTPVGRIMSRSQSDVLQLQETFELIVQSLSDILSLVGIIIIMMVVDWRLALISMSILPVLFFILGYWQKFARHSFMRIRRAIAMINGEYNQNITGVRVVESFNRQEANMKHFNDLNSEHLNANLEASRYSGALQPFVESLMGIGMGFGVVLVGGIMVKGGNLDWAVLVAFALWIQRFFEPVRHLTMQYSQLQRAMAAGVRIFEVLDLKPEVVNKPDAITLPEIKGEIKFEDVSFQYVENVDVLKEVNLHIKPGENVALVGSTGAGKSTLVTLIHRFADVTHGRITVDGHDIRDVTRHSLVSQMSMVLQEPYLFSGTVADNIRYNNENLTKDDVVAAAKTVGAHEFILSLDDGYDTVLAERGVNLSVGQRQLLSFARAVVGNPRVIILDEATANIDTHTEVLIQQALQKVLAGRTSIVIAHRLSTVRNADNIVVLDQGKLVEMGNHEELLARKGGVYARLYAVNYGLPIDDDEKSVPGGPSLAPAPADD
ncbi:MAG: ABC transporter ATP-binding protein [SAR202 cluster bacterium]|uniref:Lipid A export ATP-binding/permease protein MsbA n=1 Tax=hydrothermal vent metagenome TaxID=652676 RepID=A0A160V6Q8_9ZZZZ|nr:ABC transporter ATP-binding protein/permease [Dehalococcoidia bacterium]MCH2499351.1 ABC transporter ATP-binding protein/permease [Dehalococcoidia bacterium]MQF90826.1 ABC transporter ATP-binding protein [SAR202 cluster bacterium]MQG63452.1 ABC transporter ATP-binding protein [SAR202 cluster bacterium]|tara:strand:+ start:1990 stop:3912 length:1923 start_codon:yes stop_codon:yes gene_type:complete